MLTPVTVADVRLLNVPLKTLPVPAPLITSPVCSDWISVPVPELNVSGAL